MFHEPLENIQSVKISFHPKVEMTWNLKSKLDSWMQTEILVM